jgi:holo-[acyl-carrier protein] synthase
VDRAPLSKGESPVAIGIDFVELIKVEKVFGNNEALQGAVFTQEELRYSKRRRRPLVHLAERFAAKEAFFKALGTGLSGEADWRDVEVEEQVSGRPALKLRGETARIGFDQGVIECAVSLSHTHAHALALVLLVRKDSC